MQPTGAGGTGAAFFRTENGGYGTVWKAGQTKAVEEVPLYKELVSICWCQRQRVKVLA